MPSSQLKKGDLIINPDTQRPVRVGSRTWINLVKKGVFQNNFSDNNVLEEKYEEMPEEEFEEKIKQINEKIPSGTQAVQGRGKYANKIVKRNKPLTQEEITKTTVKKASRAVVDNIDELDEIDYEQMEKQLERLIMEKMLSTKKNNKKQQQIVEEYEDEGDLEFDENDY